MGDDVELQSDASRFAHSSQMTLAPGAAFVPDVGRRPRDRRAPPAPQAPRAPYAAVKPSWAFRALEIAIALPALVVMLPVLILIGAMIRIDSPGPALFFQYRLGAGARLFRFVKFRTLYVDARERFPELYAYRYTDDEVQTLRFKVEN